MASCLHPKFKLNWLIGEKKKIAENYLEELLGIQPDEIIPNLDKTDDNQDNFFEFHEQMDESNEEELQRYLKSKSCNIEMLHDFPKLKTYFINYNTALPSSASVERLFSISGHILRPQRCNLNDDSIEHLLLLKINKTF